MQLCRLVSAVALALALPALCAAGPVRAPRGMAPIAAGSFRPLYAQPGETIVRVAAFRLDTVPVSQADFLAFVSAHPKWQAQRVPALFADANYLRGYRNDALRPAVNVSWFAANAYCKARGARLPTTNEWEYAARADEKRRDAASPAFKQRVLELAMSADDTYRIGRGLRSVWGVRDLHGGVSEWTADFHTIFAGTDSRRSHGERALNCSAGAIDTGDASDYAAFMRYAQRATSNARTTSPNIGFRCAA